MVREILCVFAALVIVTSAKPTPKAEVRGKRSDDLGSVEVVVQQLSHQVNALTAQLTQQATKLTNKTPRSRVSSPGLVRYACRSHLQIVKYMYNIYYSS